MASVFPNGTQTMLVYVGQQTKKLHVDKHIPFILIIHVEQKVPKISNLGGFENDTKRIFRTHYWETWCTSDLQLTLGAKNMKVSLISA